MTHEQIGNEKASAITHSYLNLLRAVTLISLLFQLIELSTVSIDRYMPKSIMPGAIVRRQAIIQSGNAIIMPNVFAYFYGVMIIYGASHIAPTFSTRMKNKT